MSMAPRSQGSRTQGTRTLRLVAVAICAMGLSGMSQVAAQPLPPEPLPPEPPPIESTRPTADPVKEPAAESAPVDPADSPSSEPVETATDTKPQKLLTGELPWAPRKQSTKKLPSQRLRDARQMLGMFGIDDSQWRWMDDGVALTDGEQEILFKILFRMPRFLLEDIERWQHHAADWDEVASNVADLRGQMYLLKGTALRVEQREMLPELATAYEFRNYYRVTVAHADNPMRQSYVYTRRVPKSWPIDQPLQERVRVSGLLLKTGPTADSEGEGAPASLVFVAQRIGWHPERPNQELSVSPHRQLLASLGMDLGLLDDVVQRTGVGSRERESFYQMLAAVRHAAPRQLAEQKPTISDIDPLFQTPEQEVGQLYTFVGTARRISKVECDPDIRRRLGLPHYYQIDVFIPLEDEQIRLGRKEDTAPGEDAPVFTNNFPFTLCVAKLPKGMKEAQEMNEQIRFTAYFFKLWTYKTVYMNQFGSEKKQIGPMLIGRDIRLVVPPESGIRPYLSTIFGVLFVVALGAVWIGLWRNTKADDDFQRNTLAKSYELPAGQSLDDAGIEEAGGPDFSNWGSDSER